MKSINSKTLNPIVHAEQSDRVNFDLDSYSGAELKELKDKFVSDIKRIRSFVKHIKVRELIFDKSGKSKMTGKKHAMSATPDMENKGKRSRDSTRSRKAEAAMMRKCGAILDKLMKHRHGWVFNKPVDVVALRLVDYREIVKCPMDLGTIKENLDRGVYGSPLEFAKDVRLTFDNALLFNREGEEVHTMATILLHMFDKLFDPAYDKYEAEQENFGKEVAEKSGSKKQRTVLEGEENPPMRREMSDLERDQLGRVMEALPEKYKDKILQIMGKRNFEKMIPDADGDIELNVHTLDSETMWDIDEFVKDLQAGKNNKAI